MSKAGGRTLYLTGMMGSGKTTVGKILARRLGASFVDTDRLVEKSEGHRVSTLFKQNGEAYFRGAEKKALKRLPKKSRLVVATGGGLPLDPDNRAHMRATGTVIYLRAAPAVLAERLGRGGIRKRPLLLEQGVAALARLAKEREKFYRQADIIVPALGGPDKVADAVMKALPAQA